MFIPLENIHNVSKAQWKKWPEDARIAFNALYSIMLDNQELFRHPMGATQADPCWKTTCWNAAFESAMIAQAANKHRLKTVDVKSSISTPEEKESNDR